MYFWTNRQHKNIYKDIIQNIEWLRIHSIYSPHDGKNERLDEDDDFLDICGTACKSPAKQLEHQFQQKRWFGLSNFTPWENSMIIYTIFRTDIIYLNTEVIVPFKT